MWQWSLCKMIELHKGHRNMAVAHPTLAKAEKDTIPCWFRTSTCKASHCPTKMPHQKPHALINVWNCDRKLSHRCAKANKPASPSAKSAGVTLAWHAQQDLVSHPNGAKRFHACHGRQANLHFDCDSCHLSASTQSRQLHGCRCHTHTCMHEQASTG